MKGMPMPDINGKVV